MMEEVTNLETWAEVDGDGVVVNVVIADAEFVEATGKQYVSAGLDNSMRACIGDRWDGEQFISPRPFLSWSLVDGVWIAPKPHPKVPNPMVWDESLQEWKDNPLHPNTGA